MLCADLCGTEVMAGYPHDEVGCEGLNHFPDGVFQKCRKVLQKEAEEERALLRRQARCKHRAHTQSRRRGARSSAVVFPGAGPESDAVGAEASSSAGSRRGRRRRREERAAVTNHFDRYFDGAIRQQQQQQFPQIHATAPSPYFPGQNEHSDDSDEDNTSVTTDHIV
jgi:hypothetical protein